MGVVTVTASSFKDEILSRINLGLFFVGIETISREENTKDLIILSIIGIIHSLFTIRVFPSNFVMGFLLNLLMEYPLSWSRCSAHLP